MAFSMSTISALVAFSSSTIAFAKDHSFLAPDGISLKAADDGAIDEDDPAKVGECLRAHDPSRDVTTTTYIYTDQTCGEFGRKGQCAKAKAAACCPNTCVCMMLISTVLNEEFGGSERYFRLWCDDKGGLLHDHPEFTDGWQRAQLTLLNTLVVDRSRLDNSPLLRSSKSKSTTESTWMLTNLKNAVLPFLSELNGTYKPYAGLHNLLRMIK